MFIIRYPYWILCSKYYIKVIIIQCKVKKSPPPYLYLVHNLITFNRNFFWKVNGRNYAYIMNGSTIMIKPYTIICANIGPICTFHYVPHEVNKALTWNILCQDKSFDFSWWFSLCKCDYTFHDSNLFVNHVWHKLFRNV